MVEFWFVTPEVAGSYPVLQPISHPKCRAIMATVAQINKLRKATQVRAMSNQNVVFGMFYGF